MAIVDRGRLLKLHKAFAGNGKLTSSSTNFREHVHVLFTAWISLGVGFLLTRLYSMNLISAFLGTAPGGMGEMGLTAVLVRVNVSLVTAYQMFRLLFILFVVPFLLKWRFGSISKGKTFET